MTNQEATLNSLTEKVTERVNELIKLKEVQEHMDSLSAEDAKEWIFNQALITLLYTPEERAKAVETK